jgi:hypothetical protein
MLTVTAAPLTLAGPLVTLCNTCFTAENQRAYDLLACPSDVAANS